MVAGTTGWRRLIGSPKLQIIFQKRATKYRSLLRKMTYEDKGFYELSPPCTTQLSQTHYTEEVSRTCGFWDTPPRKTPSHMYIFREIMLPVFIENQREDQK